MTKFTVNLKALRAAGACFEGYNKLVRSLQGTAFTGDDAKRASYLPYKYEKDINVLQILESNGLDDALWALCCVEGCDKDMRLYAVWCARQVQHLMSDNRSIIALDVAEKYADGLVTEEELKTARDAAWEAAEDAAWAVTKDAARDAAWATARDAAWATARDAAAAPARDAAWATARDAAWATARDAAGDAARDAAWDAARAVAWAAAWSAAWAAARVSQKDMLILMLNNKATWQV